MLAIDISSLDLQNKDIIQTISGITWTEYETILNDKKESKSRLSFLDGTIEIMSPSLNHEVIKEFIGILIVGYCEKFEIDYYPMGSTTLKQQDKLAAKEPDISYSFTEAKLVPDLAIEVVFTSGNRNDLEKYRRLEVQEVWFWIEDNLEVYILDDGQYYKRDTSSIFPLLKLDLVNKYVKQVLNESPRKLKQSFLEN